MMSCCSLCYSKYIKEDGAVDLNLYIEALGQFMQYTFDSMKERVSQGYGLKKIGFDKDIFDTNKICMCRCHIVGSEVLH